MKIVSQPILQSRKAFIITKLMIFVIKKQESIQNHKTDDIYKIHLDHILSIGDRCTSLRALSATVKVTDREYKSPFSANLAGARRSIASDLLFQSTRSR